MKKINLLMSSLLVLASVKAYGSSTFSDDKIMCVVYDTSNPKDIKSYEIIDETLNGQEEFTSSLEKTYEAIYDKDCGGVSIRISNKNGFLYMDRRCYDFKGNLNLYTFLDEDLVVKENADQKEKDRVKEIISKKEEASKTGEVVVVNRDLYETHKKSREEQGKLANGLHISCLSIHFRSGLEKRCPKHLSPVIIYRSSKVDKVENMANYDMEALKIFHGKANKEEITACEPKELILRKK